MRQTLSPDLHWEELRHRSLGGLTSARVLVAWRGGSPAKLIEVQPAKRNHPVRPLAAFLEPAVSLLAWRRPSMVTGEALQDCWCPHSSGAKPYPWPLRDAPLWVCTTSVLLKGVGLLERPLMVKERAQLVDLREDWGNDLLDLVWQWDRGASPPLRIVVEFVLSAADWLCGEQTSREMPPAKDKDKAFDVFDWSRVHPPLLSNISGVAGISLERLAYFGWVWEPSDGANVMV